MVACWSGCITSGMDMNFSIVFSQSTIAHCQAGRVVLLPSEELTLGPISIPQQPKKN